MNLEGFALEESSRTDSTIATTAEAWSEVPSPFWSLKPD